MDWLVEQSDGMAIEIHLDSLNYMKISKTRFYSSFLTIPGTLTDRCRDKTIQN